MNAGISGVRNIMNIAVTYIVLLSSDTILTVDLTVFEQISNSSFKLLPLVR
jgi:hypothetical protein